MGEQPVRGAVRLSGAELSLQIHAGRHKLIMRLPIMEGNAGAELFFCPAAEWQGNAVWELHRSCVKAAGHER